MRTERRLWLSIAAVAVWLLPTADLMAFCAPQDERSSDAVNVAAPVRLVLPREVPAVVGLELNLYFDNLVLVLNPANYAFDVICAKGR